MIIKPSTRLAHVNEYYFSTKLREIRNRMAEGQDIINLGIGSPDLPPSDTTIKQLIQAALEPGNHAYQPYKGIPLLRTGFADWYFNTYGVSLNPETEILPLIGSKEGIMHISMAFLDPGDEVLVPNPGYPTYAAATLLAGGTVRYYDLKAENQWYPNLEQLSQSDLSKVKLMWINYPHMPTGAAPSEKLFIDLVEFARKHQILLCHDNPYSLVLNPTPMSILGIEGSEDYAIELNSMSKSHNMSGWRVGMVGGKQSYIDTVLKFKSNMDSGMFMPLQLAAAHALNNSYSWHRERNETYKVRREIVWKIFDLLGCTYDPNQVGMFIWARVPEGYSSGEALSDYLLDTLHVFMTPGFVFGDNGNNYIRASLCTPIERLRHALERVNSIGQPEPITPNS